MSSRHTLLIVDDEPDVVKSVQDLLRLDYRVLGATKAKDALEILHKEEIHVVMTDQRMPEMTGVEFLKHVRGEHPEAVRLLFTGYADIRAVIEAINQGSVYRYITKPWDPEELETVIREAVERYDLLVERKKLFALLQTQNRNLERANAELSRANELKHAFIQVASHELRTPLTILLGFARLAQQTAGEASPARPLLGRIEQAGGRLQRLVDQLISMLSAGNFEQQLERKPTDMAALLTEAADDVRPFIALRRQTLNLDLKPDLQTADVAPSRIRDSVNHLLLNAIKFTPDGGTISMTAGDAGNGKIQISVSDTGAGIDPEALPRLFQPFFTAFDVSHHSSGHYEHGRRGIGLGLSVVKAFTEMHGGTIDVHSEPGKGSTFVITLPRKETAPAAKPEEGQAKSG